MARRSSGGRSSGSRSASARFPSRNPPQPAPHAPAPVPKPSGNEPVMGGFGAAVADGLAFGAGNAVAHRAVDAVAGPWVIKHETVASSAPAANPAPPTTSSHEDACGVQTKAFIDCLNSYGNDISKCQYYMDMMQECHKRSGAALSA